MLAKVVSIDGALKAELIKPEACEHCAQCSLFSDKRFYDLPPGDWHEGDSVDIELSRMNPAKVSALGYGVPLAGMVLFVGIAALLGLGDIWQAAFAVAGLALSFLALRLIDRRARKNGAFQTTCTRCEGGIHNGQH